MLLLFPASKYINKFILNLPPVLLQLSPFLCDCRCWGRSADVHLTAIIQARRICLSHRMGFPSCHYLNVLVTALPLNMFTRPFVWKQLEFPFVHSLLAVALDAIFVDLLCTTEGINRQLLISVLQLCTCAADGFERPHKQKSFVTGRQRSHPVLNCTCEYAL